MITAIIPFGPKKPNKKESNNKFIHVSQVLGAWRMTMAVDFTLNFKSS